ncbi:MAG TPA: hypothetical protein VKV77_14445 [Methylovirgula sp.]|nr:hypothetical protein [Methylovirgula sp.]
MPNLDCDIEPRAYTAPDVRADGGIRTIRLAARGVGIERMVGGIKMHLLVPIEAYRGLFLTRSLDRHLCMRLVHRDPDLSVILPDTDAPWICEILREWSRIFSGRAIARSSAQPRRVRGLRRARRRRFQRLAAPPKRFEGAREICSWED